MPQDPEEHQQALLILKRTHQIYCGLKGVDIALIYSNPPGRTDCETFIALPPEDPDAGIIHKHEWSHIFFKSNLRARQFFVEDYVSELKTRILSEELWSTDVANFVHLLINALDDLRVASLWGLIYPSSAEAIKRRWAHIISSSGRYRRDMVMYLLALGLGIPDLQMSDWNRYSALLTDAAAKVAGRGFQACLVIAKMLLDTIIYDVIRQSLSGHTSPTLQSPVAIGASPQAGGSQAVASTLLKMVHGAAYRTRWDLQNKSSAILADTDRIPTGRDPDWESTKRMAESSLRVSTEEQLQAVLDRSQAGMAQILKTLQESEVRSPTADERLLLGVQGQVIFRDIEPSMVQELHLSVYDKRTVAALRQSFVRLVDRRSRSRTDSGSELDTDAYIDLMTGGGDEDIFREESSSRGFSALVLLDMSSSMKSKWDVVSRACKVLARSLRFPFSTFDVWGFSSDEDGRTTILRFKDNEKGYWGPGLRDVWGMTPLHLAVEVGIKKLLMTGNVAHLIALTDGVPTHFGLRSGSMPSSETLISEVAEKIRLGRQKGVNSSGLVVGWDVRDEVADFMFGHSRFWRRAGNDEDLFRVMVGLVQSAFYGYLRCRWR